MVLDLLEFYNGLTGTIFVIISIFVALKLISKYYEHNKRNLLFAGLTWLIICETYWPVAISFIMILSINQTLSTEAYFLIGAIMIPVGLLSWLVVFTDLVYKSKQKLILGLVLITGFIWEIFYLYFLFTNPDIIVEKVGLVDGEYKSFALYYFLAVLGTFLITGLIFANDTLKSEDPSLRLKGKLLIGAFITFSVGIALDGLTPLNFITITIYRILVILAALLFYSGFFLPNWLEKLILKK
ncbi:MAG: hypothetical protein EU532_10840 [Promethearchaeota archaeon]|nr:MAG: hypothetical protein EU532_10840 [Candidatus Lokiarchaeota archaeon]